MFGPPPPPRKIIHFLNELKYYCLPTAYNELLPLFDLHCKKFPAILHWEMLSNTIQTFTGSEAVMEIRVKYIQG